MKKLLIAIALFASCNTRESALPKANENHAAKIEVIGSTSFNNYVYSVKYDSCEYIVCWFGTTGVAMTKHKDNHVNSKQ